MLQRTRKISMKGGRIMHVFTMAVLTREQQLD